jgi:hypothetical protein
MSDVLDLLLAEILEDKGQPVAHVVMNRIGDEHPAGFGQGLDPGGDVDAVAIEVVALDDYVAEIDADAHFDAVVRTGGGVPLGHRLLHLDRAAHRIDDAGEFDQQPVAGGLDDAARAQSSGQNAGRRRGRGRNPERGVSGRLLKHNRNLQQ